MSPLPNGTAADRRALQSAGPQVFDPVLGIGATHAFDGLLATLDGHVSTGFVTLPLRRTSEPA